MRRFGVAGHLVWGIAGTGKNRGGNASTAPSCREDTAAEKWQIGNFI